ncbi:GNAT family N-acetyltransferase [Alicyclobacillus acidiphilus]|uniref:GNAT family N-acetyltransferase n=1 Tax=Alicyclobacillus acidiphilus TaxID=182455 RepID=UPI000836A8EF|nr:GNAT family N-acetyltransferase [Alicyclobacillus acidiphilus]
MDISIRLLTPEDAQSYRSLRLEALSRHPEAFLTSAEEFAARSLEQIADSLSPSTHVRTFGAFLEDSSLVGMVTLVRERSAKASHIADVVGMYVTDSQRRRAIGTRLLAALIDVGRSMPGLEQLRLSVNRENRSALGLYQKVGFQVYGTEPRAIKWMESYWDEAHMILFLDDVSLTE